MKVTQHTYNSLGGVPTFCGGEVYTRHGVTSGAACFLFKVDVNNWDMFNTKAMRFGSASEHPEYDMVLSGYGPDSLGVITVKGGTEFGALENLPAKGFRHCQVKC